MSDVRTSGRRHQNCIPISVAAGRSLGNNPASDRVEPSTRSVRSWGGRSPNMERVPIRYPVVMPIVIVAAFALFWLVLRPHIIPGPGPVFPSVDLRRVTFPTAGITVSEHGTGQLQIVTDTWMLSVTAIGIPTRLQTS